MILYVLSFLHCTACSDLFKLPAHSGTGLSQRPILFKRAQSIETGFADTACGPFGCMLSGGWHGGDWKPAWSGAASGARLASFRFGGVGFGSVSGVTENGQRDTERYREPRRVEWFVPVGLFRWPRWEGIFSLAENSRGLRESSVDQASQRPEGCLCGTRSWSKNMAN
jgi:hypothetical protein